MKPKPQQTRRRDLWVLPTVVTVGIVVGSLVIMAMQEHGTQWMGRQPGWLGVLLGVLVGVLTALPLGLLLVPIARRVTWPVLAGWGFLCWVVHIGSLFIGITSRHGPVEPESREWLRAAWEYSLSAALAYHAVLVLLCLRAAHPRARSSSRRRRRERRAVQRQSTG